MHETPLTALTNSHTEGAAMRIVCGSLLGVTAMLLAWILWKPALNRRRIDRFLEWIFTRVEVPTHPDCQPRYWTTHHGVIAKGEWT